jgi:hypothetical protein
MGMCMPIWAGGGQQGHLAQVPSIGMSQIYSYLIKRILMSKQEYADSVNHLYYITYNFFHK